MMLAVLAVAGAGASAPAQAQVQADVGLTVVDVAYERPVTRHVSAAVEAGIFGTYFLPWFDLGDDVKGVNAGARVTWFAREAQRGLYVAPYVRAAGVRGEGDASGYAITAGAFVGWAFRLSERFDLRLGVGAQYIYIDADPLGASTPFVAIDGVIAYRL